MRTTSSRRAVARFDDSNNLTAARGTDLATPTTSPRSSTDLTTPTTSLRRARTAARSHDSNLPLTAACAWRHRFDDSYNLTTASPRARGIPTTRRWCWRASTKAWITTESLGGKDYYKIWCSSCLGGSQARIHGIQRANLTRISTSREASILAQI
jgi:hypothetical protein